MSKKTIISLQFGGHRFQVVEERFEWRANVKYDLLQDRRLLRSNTTLASATYELMQILRNNFCRV